MLTIASSNPSIRPRAVPRGNISQSPRAPVAAAAAMTAGRLCISEVRCRRSDARLWRGIQPAFPQERAAWAESPRYGRRHEHSHVSRFAREPKHYSVPPIRADCIGSLSFVLSNHAQQFLFIENHFFAAAAGQIHQARQLNGIDGGKPPRTFRSKCSAARRS